MFYKNFLLHPIFQKDLPLRNKCPHFTRRAQIVGNKFLAEEVKKEKRRGQPNKRFGDAVPLELTLVSRHHETITDAALRT